MAHDVVNTVGIFKAVVFRNLHCLASSQHKNALFLVFGGSISQWSVRQHNLAVLHVNIQTGSQLLDLLLFDYTTAVCQEQVGYLQMAQQAQGSLCSGERVVSAKQLHVHVLCVKWFQQHP